MPGPLKNARHERFAQEYLRHRDAFRAAADCDVEFKAEGNGFYVYFLIDGGDGSIFYVGKGKGDRLHSHRRSVGTENPVNHVKVKRIRECGSRLLEVVFVDDLDEVSAFRIEKHLIGALKSAGLSNISSGSVHPLESVLASIDHGMSLIRGYDEWIARAHPRQLEAARKLSGSTEAFYADFWHKFEDLRHHVQRELNSIRAKSNVSTRR